MSKKNEDLKQKDLLIQKAIENFSSKGFEATNLSDITKSLGLSRCPAYYHFENKSGLYRAAYDQWEAEFQSNHEHVLNQNKPVLAILKETIFCCFEMPQYFSPQFFFGIEKIPELADIHLRHQKLTETIYNKKLALVDQGIRNGEINPDISNKLVVDLIYIIYDGIRARLERSSEYTANDIQVWVDFLMKGLAESIK